MIDFKKKFAQIKEIGDRDPEKIVFAPYRDWAIIVTVSLVAILGIGVLHFFIYMKIDKGNFSYEATEVKNAGDLDIEKLNETVNMFTERENSFNERYNNKVILVDPSL